jgi:hypothetical protein
VELTGKITLTPFVHRKIYHSQAFPPALAGQAMGFSISAKAIHRVGFVIHLQARGFYLHACLLTSRERKVQPPAFIGL